MTVKQSDFAAMCEEITKRILGLPVPEHVVDLRCGTGGLSLRISQMFQECRVTGLDGMSDSVRQASQATMQAGVANRVKFDRNDQRTIPLADLTADLITGVAALSSSTLPQGLLKEIDRVLIPGGHAVLGEWIFDERTGPAPPNLPLLLSQESPTPPLETIQSWIATSSFADSARWEVDPDASPRPTLILTIQKPQSIADRRW